MQTVIVKIDAEGNVKVEAAGVIGSGCQALTRAIEESLGKVSADQKKQEFFQRQQVNATRAARHHQS